MSTPILSTKLYTPPPRHNAVQRPRLIARLTDGQQSKLTLISASAGFGKTTLISAWVMNDSQAVAWLSLDEGDNDPIRFLMYLVAALQTVAPHLGAGLMAVIQTPQPPPPDSLLTILLNEIAALSSRMVLILDDYHVIEAAPVNSALAFLIEHMPPQLRVIIVTRENPPLPLARYRARGQLTELRAADLRFTHAEAAEFLNRVMGLHLSADDIRALEQRTEGWIAGLQMAALSMQGRDDTASFIEAFTGSHHFVLDYLMEEVLRQQSASIQAFLLHTSILDRLCGPLCDAVVLDASLSGQATLEYLERANLFIIPLDDERRWYRYHHLFADLLRQRLHQTNDAQTSIPHLHIRASQWYEDNGLMVEAFHHAAAANDIDRAARLIEGSAIPRHFRGAVVAVINWLASLPKAVLDARPTLWWTYASLLLVNGQTTGVEEKLQAAEAGLSDTSPDPVVRNLIGQIATARSTLALTRYEVDEILVQSGRALEYLHPDNLSYRAAALWSRGFAYFSQGDRATAGQVFTEGVAISQAAGDTFSTILTATGLGQVQEAEAQLHLAAETYRYVLRIAGDQPIQIIYEAHLGLAQILYQWNDLEAAAQHGQQSLQLARQYDTVIDRFVVCEIFLVQLSLAQGDVSSAAARLGEVDQFVRQHNFVHRVPDVAAMQVLVLLRQGHVEPAAQVAQAHPLPLSQARVLLAQGDPAAALALLEGLRQQADEKQWQDERLKIMVLQILAHDARGDKAQALHVLSDALRLAEPGGFIRLFVDEGQPMADLLNAVPQAASNYVQNLLAAFPSDERNVPAPIGTDMVEPLTDREREVLHLIAEGLTNQDIATKLFLSLHTVKVHVRNINGKLGTSNRTQAVARGREIKLLP